MRFAYADPPYPGMAKRYKDTPWAQEVNHRVLIGTLSLYDGWALSTNPGDLRDLLPMCPANVRVAAWVKPFTTWRPGLRCSYAWEPVIFMPGRRKGGRGIPTVRDWLAASQNHGGGSGKRSILGAKPPAFCTWLLDILGFDVGDEMDDLFPGTGSLGYAVAARQNGMVAAR